MTDRPLRSRTSRSGASTPAGPKAEGITKKVVRRKPKTSPLAISHFHDVDLRDATFEDSDLGGALLTNVKAPRLRINDADLTGAGVMNSSLRKARFEDVTLQDARFRNCSLAGASLEDVDLSNLSIRDAKIEGLTIDGVDIAKLLARSRKARS